MSVGEAVSRFPRERTWLLPALQSAQRADGWLSPETLAAVEADHAYRGRVSEAALDALLDTPAVHVVAAPLTGRGGPPATPVTAGSPGARFTVLRREAERRRTGSRLAVGVGTCGLAVGAGET